LAQGKRAPQAVTATGFRKHLTAIDAGTFGGSNSSLGHAGWNRRRLCRFEDHKRCTRRCAGSGATRTGEAAGGGEADFAKRKPATRRRKPANDGPC